MNRFENFLDSAAIAKAFPRPAATEVPRIHPKNIEERAKNGRAGMCLDSHGGNGACIKESNHASADHRDATGRGWTRPAPDKRFVRPPGQPQDTSMQSGGSQSVMGERDAPELAKPKLREHIKRVKSTPWSQQAHSIYSGPN